MPDSSRTEVKDRIVAAAVSLLAEGGRAAVSTRTVSAAAGVQSPTIYRLFGDMDGLLDEVASHAFRTYLGGKTDREYAADPVDDLRRGWDIHVGFGLANPELYKLMQGQPDPHRETATAREGAAILHGLVERIAATGQLAVEVSRAAQMIHSAGVGTTLTLIATPEESRDSELSERVREAILAAITIRSAGEPEVAEPSIVQHTIALKALLPALAPEFSPGEFALLGEWLDRMTFTHDT